MSRLIINLLFLLIIVAVMIYQAYRSPARSYRRAAFSTATGAFALLVLFNLNVLVQQETAPWTIAVLWLVFVLLLASLIFLALSWRKGEMQEKMDRIRQAVADERQRRGIPEQEQKQPEKKEKQ